MTNIVAPSNAEYSNPVIWSAFSFALSNTDLLTSLTFLVFGFVLENSKLSEIKNKYKIKLSITKNDYLRDFLF